MTSRSSLRGHPNHYDTDAECWRYSDTGEPTAETWRDRPCGVCGEPSTQEGHDPCLGTLPGVLNACCGHGAIREAYVQMANGELLTGELALAWARDAR
jgi:hypothetical protein